MKKGRLLVLVLYACTCSAVNEEHATNEERITNEELRQRVGTLETQLAAASNMIKNMRRGSSDGDDGVWYHNDAQYAFFTGLILFFLIIIAVALLMHIYCILYELC